MNTLNDALASFNTKKGISLNKQSDKQIAKRQKFISAFVEAITKEQLNNMKYLLKQASKIGEMFRIGQKVISRHKEELGSIQDFNKDSVTVKGDSLFYCIPKGEFIRTHKKVDGCWRQKKSWKGNPPTVTKGQEVFYNDGSLRGKIVKVGNKKVAIAPAKGAKNINIPKESFYSAHTYQPDNNSWKVIL